MGEDQARYEVFPRVRTRADTTEAAQWTNCVAASEATGVCEVCEDGTHVGCSLVSGRWLALALVLQHLTLHYPHPPRPALQQRAPPLHYHHHSPQPARPAADPQNNLCCPLPSPQLRSHLSCIPIPRLFCSSTPCPSSRNATPRLPPTSTK